MRDSYNCNEVEPLTNDETKEGQLTKIIAENEITDVIDMTNTACKRAEEEPDCEILKNVTSSQSVHLFTPIFSTPLDIRMHKACRKQTFSPILPGICYPFELAAYKFPCDLGTHLFWQSYMSAETELNCKAIGIQNE